ncbi:MAG: hypothetical protein AMXMBFR33_04840 [Candidatus Xenobia bacterium]
MRRSSLWGLCLLACLMLAALAAPPISVRPTRLVVPLGEARSAAWQGPSRPEVIVSDPEVAEARLEGNRVVVRGLAEGDALVSLSFGSREVGLPIQVRTPAARLPARLSVSLTGESVSHTVLSQALRVAMDAQTGLDPRAQLSLQPRRANGALLVDVSASGPGLLPVSRTIAVDVSLQQLPFTPARTLVVSNRPELVLAPGMLLDRPLPPGPSRLLYHHRGSPDAPHQELEVLLKNVNATPARVRVAVASVGPSNDEIFAGHKAAQLLLDQQEKAESFFLRVGPGQEVVLDRKLLKSGQTVSGMGWLEPLDGSQLRVLVRASEHGRGSIPSEEAPDTGGRTGRGLFPAAMDVAHAHNLGGPFTYMPLGEAPFEVEPGTGETNYGHFGMVYRVRVLLINPDAVPRKAWIDFVPRAGPARGSLYVDGQRVETDMGNSASEIKVGEWELEPGEQREVRIETFPQSGSNYPVFLVVKSNYANGAIPAPARPEVVPGESQFMF